MRALLLIALVAVLVGGGLKLAGVPLPMIDYAVGPFGEGRGPGGGEITIEAPGFNNPDAFGQ
jgi:hypothetical protein